VVLSTFDPPRTSQAFSQQEHTQTYLQQEHFQAFAQQEHTQAFSQQGYLRHAVVAFLSLALHTHWPKSEGDG